MQCCDIPERRRRRAIVKTRAWRMAEGIEMEMGKNLGDEEEFDESSLLSSYLFLVKVDE